MPTVSRTIQQLVEKGMVNHEARGLVKLTAPGEAIAQDLIHRHEDVVAFLELLLGLPRELAELDACRVEHSLSKLTTQRLHALMNYLESLPASDRNRLRTAVKRSSEKEPTFHHLVEVKMHGWRG